MPIYEYHCTNCNHQFEEIQGFNDEPLTKCPECGKLKLEKLISAPAFHLKGTGWYVTDFKDKDKKTKTAKNDSDTGKSSTETSSETKTTDTAKTTKPKAEKE